MSVPRQLIDGLRARYSEPHRRYHTWEHISRLLGLYREFEAEWHRPVPVLWALYWHDAVYDPHRSDNEEESAELLEAEASGYLGERDTAFAAGIIRATATHNVPPGLNENDRQDIALFLDLDLSMLGAPRLEFERYQDQIRAEFAFMNKTAFRAARRGILEGFLSRPRIYQTAIGRVKWEVRARENLRRALAV